METLNRYGKTDNGMMRLAYSKPERDAVACFAELCEREGMQVRYDACGNLIARKEGRNPELPAVAFGSHLDTVSNGGRYDGAAGVAAAISVIHSFNLQGVQTDCPLEIICFACEESSRFGVSTIGSKAMSGELKKEGLERLKDNKGITLPEALDASGYTFASIEDSLRDGKELRAFFELHIEQGPYLENEKKQIGVVYAIAAPVRLSVTVRGRTAHSGATPIHMRKDALLGAAEIALELEAMAKRELLNGMVATVGVLSVNPGAINVVPGLVEMQVDIRCSTEQVKRQSMEEVRKLFERVGRERGLSMEWELLSDESPTLLHGDAIASIRAACESLGFSYAVMPSGAGHDAMNMTRLCPTGLLFIPSREGLSHHPDEYTSIDSLAEGAMVLGKVIRQWAQAKGPGTTE